MNFHVNSGVISFRNERFRRPKAPRLQRPTDRATLIVEWIEGNYIDAEQTKVESLEKRSSFLLTLSRR